MNIFKTIKLNTRQDVCVDTELLSAVNSYVHTTITLLVSDSLVCDGYVSICMSKERTLASHVEEVTDNFGCIEVPLGDVLMHGVKAICNMSNTELKALGAELTPRLNLQLRSLANDWL